MTKDSDRLMTTKEVADFCAVSVSTVNEARRAGDLEATPFGPHRIRYKKSAVERWIDLVERRAHDEGDPPPPPREHGRQ